MIAGFFGALLAFVVVGIVMFVGYKFLLALSSDK